MSGLLLTIDAGERFFVNGALLENGDRPARIRVRDNDARVLRCRDALEPQAVNTPVKRVYYAIQLMITGDIEDEDVLPALRRECERLADVFATVDGAMIPSLLSMFDRGNYYSALCHLRRAIVLEAELLERFGVELGNAADRSSERVA